MSSLYTLLEASFMNEKISGFYIVVIWKPLFFVWNVFHEAILFNH